MKVPSAYTLIFILIILVSILTWILPAGKYDRVYDSSVDREVIVAGTYKQIEKTPQGFESIITSFFKGLVSASEIIAYVIIIGGSYGVIFKTKAIHSALGVLIQKLDKKAFLLIPFLMILFSALGTINGCCEETVAFYGIMIPVVLAMGYDSILALSIIFLGAGTGVLASTVNPFSIGLGSAVAHISVQEGMWYRLAGWVICTSVSIAYVLWYARRIKKDPTKSYVYGIHNASTFSNLETINKDGKDIPKLTLDKKIIAILFLCMSGVLAYGITALEWDFAQMSMVFLGLAFISAIITREKEDKFWDSFLEGAKDLLAPAILVGLSRAIVLIAIDGNIMDSVLYYLHSFFENSSKISFVVINQFVETLLATLVTSSSGHVVLTIPISAPLAEMLHVPLSTIVTSLQYASGLANLFSPASAILLASLAIAKVPYIKWMKFLLPLLAIQIVIVFTITIISVL